MKHETIAQVIEAIFNSQTDPEELCLLLELTVEDIVDRFEDRLLDHAHKFGVYTYYYNDDDGIELVPDGSQQYEHEAEQENIDQDTD
jgi:hypothetical protein